MFSIKRSPAWVGGTEIWTFVSLSLSSRVPVLSIQAVEISVWDAALETGLEGRRGLVGTEPSPVKTIASVSSSQPESEPEDALEGAWMFESLTH